MELWQEQCEAARGIENEFGTQPALKYLVEEKFLNFLEASDSDAKLRSQIPAFVAQIKTIFEPWQLAEHLKSARVSEAFNAADYADEDEETIEFARQDDIRQSAADLLLVERARAWLLEDG